MRIRTGLLGFIAVIQAVLFLTHLFLYQTWVFSPTGHTVVGPSWLKVLLGALSVSFLVSSLLAFRYTGAVLRLFYRASAIWLGLLSFLFLGAVSSWAVYGLSRLAGLAPNFHLIVEFLFAAALVTGLYGVFNASWTRITPTKIPSGGLSEWLQGHFVAQAF